jgi:hypothetical protein
MSLAQAAAHFATKSSGRAHHRMLRGPSTTERKRCSATLNFTSELQGRFAQLRGSGAARPLRGLRRGGQERTKRPPQAVVFEPPTIVFRFAHPDRAKRFGDWETVRRQRLDHLKPLDDLPRAELRTHHHHRHPRNGRSTPKASDRPPRSGTERCASPAIRKLASGLILRHRIRDRAVPRARRFQSPRLRAGVVALLLTNGEALCECW